MSTETQATTEQLNPFAIFSTNVEDIKSFEETSGGKDWDSIFYEPSPEEGKPYVAAIKFLPNIYNALNPIVSKYFYKLVNPDNGKPLYYDSPSSIGENCAVLNEWSRLYNSEDVRDKAQSKKYKRTRQRCAVIQVIKDPQKSTLEGQLRLFRMQLDGDIDNSIKAKLKPSKEELALDPTLKPVDIFNPFSSPLLKIKAIQNANGRDFAGSTWADGQTGMIIDGKPLTLADAGNAEIQAKIIALLQADHVNVTEHFQYKPADEARTALVVRAIQKMSNAPIVDETVSTDTAAPAEGTTPAPQTETAAPVVEAATATVVNPGTAEQTADVWAGLGLDK